MFYTDKQVSLGIFMFHGLLNPHIMALTIAICAALACPLHCQHTFADTTYISTNNDSQVASTVNSSRDQPTMMTTPDSAAYLDIAAPHNQPMLITAPLIESRYSRIDFPDHKPKMMASGYTGYKVLDEFGKQTTVPFVGGILNITNCIDGAVYKYGKRDYKLPEKRLFRIPGETINITDTELRIIYLNKCCTNCGPESSQMVPGGYVFRLAESPDQCLNKMYCGVLTDPYVGMYICIGIQNDGTDECKEFKDRAYDNYTGMAYTTMPGNEACTKDPLNITYSKKNGTKIPLIPGTLIMVMIEDEGVHLYAEHKQQSSFFCKIVTKGHLYKYEVNGTLEVTINPEHLFKYEVNGTEEVTINPEHQLMVDGIVRVDCDIVIVKDWANATTYFFIADGELKVNEKCKDGKVSCSVPAWVNEYTNPVINYGTEEGLTCTAQFTSCFPKMTTGTMSTKTRGPNCTDTDTEKEKEPMDTVGKATAGFFLLIGLAVIMLMLCFIIFLGIAYWFGSNQTRTPSELPENEKLKGEEEKKISGSESAVGHMDYVITPEKNAAIANAPLEEALKDNDKSVSVADAQNDKEDMVTARDTV